MAESNASRAMGKSDVAASAIGLGTWAMGGWMWGGSDEAKSIAAIRASIDKGVTLIDTKPASTFSRRRYVFEVDNEVLAQSQFDMPILWGLRDKSLQALNVLFAECVDRRVRPSTLRYQVR